MREWSKSLGDYADVQVVGSQRQVPAHERALNGY